MPWPAYWSPFRAIGAPPKIDLGLIKTLGIAPSKEREAFNALSFLGVIDDLGAPSPLFDQLKQNYQPTLQRIVREKYALLFEQIPTNLITQESVVNFFVGTGTGKDTAEYQGMLFGWLCRQAGIQVPNLPEKFHRARFDKNGGVSKTPRQVSK